MKHCSFFSMFSMLWGLAIGMITIPAMAAQNRADRTVTITKADCSRLTRHVPSADTAYKPGVDVHGRPVVAADVGGASRIQVPEDITIVITVDIQERFSIPANSTLFEPEAYIGNVTVHKDGTTFFNGKPLINEEQRALAHLCQRQAKQR